MKPTFDFIKEKDWRGEDLQHPGLLAQIAPTISQHFSSRTQSAMNQQQLRVAPTFKDAPQPTQANMHRGVAARNVATALDFSIRLEVNRRIESHDSSKVAFGRRLEVDLFPTERSLHADNSTGRSTHHRDD
jgi:hypothetical protein